MLYVIECYLNASTEFAYLLVVGSVERASQHLVRHIYAYESEQTRNAYQCIDLCAVSNAADLDLEIAIYLARGIVECHCFRFCGAVARPVILHIERAGVDFFGCQYGSHRITAHRSNILAITIYINSTNLYLIVERVLVAIDLLNCNCSLCSFNYLKSPNAIVIANASCVIRFTYLESCHCRNVLVLRKTPYRFVLRCKFNT